MTPETLAEISARAYTHMTPWTADQFASTLSHPASLLSLSTHAFVLGQVVLDEAEILALATDPNHHRTGEAGAAFALFCQDAKARGALKLFLEVAKDNIPAIQFYKNAGFLEAGLRRAYYARSDRPKMDALIMTANIAQ